MKKEFNDGSLQITDIHKKETAHPLIVNFQNEFLPSSIEHTTACGIYRNSSTPSQPLTAAVMSGGMLYVGNEIENPYSNNYLLVKSKTGSVRLIEVGNASLRAIIPEVLDTTELEKNELREKFGSKRMKRYAEQTKKMKIDVETVKEELESSALLMEIDPSDISNRVAEAESSICTYTPPIDRNATDPRQVYKLSEIINNEQLDTLKSTANILLHEDDYDIEISEYVTKLIGNLRKTEFLDKEKNCCVLLYVDCIIRYLTGSYKMVCSPKHVICTYSDVINNMVYDHFSTVSNDKGRSRSQSSKDKAICHIIVMLLIVFDCTISDIEKLRMALGITTKKFASYVKIVGARMTSGVLPTIVLKIPLVSPPSLHRRDKR